MCACTYTVHDCSSCARKVIIGTYLRLHTNINTVTMAILQDGIQYTHDGCQHKHSNKHSGTYICKDKRYIYPSIFKGKNKT